jgi:hypothetical protein
MCGERFLAERFPGCEFLELYPVARKEINFSHRRYAGGEAT